MTEPRTDTETRTAKIFCDILGVAEIDVTENVFTAGMDSIRALRAIDAISRDFAIRFPVWTFFNSPTVERLASEIDTEVRAADARDIEAALARLDAPGAADVS